jgi:hypothetical protein
MHTQVAKLDSGTGWTIIVDHEHGDLAGLVGWIKFECYDPSSHALLGKDAYQFTRSIENQYSFEKVAYEFHS